jgi:hypothetical protein
MAYIIKIVTNDQKFESWKNFTMELINKTKPIVTKNEIIFVISRIAS